MADWIEHGNCLLAIDSIEIVEQFDKGRRIVVTMRSGRAYEYTENAAVNIWNFLYGDRVQFLDSDNPMRNFSR